MTTRPEDPLRIDTTTTGAIRLAGDPDAATAPYLQAALTERLATGPDRLSSMSPTWTSATPPAWPCSSAPQRPPRRGPPDPARRLRPTPPPARDHSPRWHVHAHLTLVATEVGKRWQSAGGGRRPGICGEWRHRWHPWSAHAPVVDGTPEALAVAGPTQTGPTAAEHPPGPGSAPAPQHNPARPHPMPCRADRHRR